jgi:hypothetical protein
MDMRRLTARKRRVKLSGDELLRRLRLGDLRKLFADRCRGRVLPDDDAGREYLRELLLPISLGPNEAVKRARAIGIWTSTDRMRREIELSAPWMAAGEVQEFLDEINLMPPWQRKPMARTLGERLQLTYAERARLQLKTVGPCDMSEAGMALIRKQKKRQRNRVRYAQSRAAYLAASISKAKPWVAAGVSRATWYRWHKERISNQRETSPSQVNLTKTVLLPVSLEERGVSKGVGKGVREGSKECSRDAAPTPAVLAQTRVEWDSIWAEEMAWMPNPMAQAA